jgi:CRISPR system Cascade subunit CasB
MIPFHEAAPAARAWWQAMQPDPEKNRPGDRAALAKLRRCATIAEAMQEPAALLLFRAVKATRSDDLPIIGLTAAVLAHVRSDGPTDKPRMTVARQVGPDSLEKPKTALLKPLRFRRLMEADGPEERLLAFRRLVAIAGGALPVRDLAEALLHWTDQRRVRWVYDYWNVVPATTPHQTEALPKDTQA